ncbi:anti-sigma factor [Nocardia abscessus]|uniref:anti-sigma factor n=1 Tax=Nocardia TaxID=1817 RepID=UPI001892E3CF|nr:MULTISPECIES: anti-sigma factor [Nocardia]MBF6217689.1 anti-sigma factor [Nocardia abscessus]MDE1672793.1 anti-sigma factor [Nocardia gipuzkoensis]
MVDTSPRSDADLIDLAYPCALNAVADIERRHIDARLAAADPDVRRAFSDAVWQARDVMGRLAVLDEFAPPPELERRILAALPDLRERRSVTRISSWRRPLRWAVPIVAAACLVVGGSLVAAQFTGSSSDPVAASEVPGQPGVRTVNGAFDGGGLLVVDASPELGRAIVVFDGVAPPPAGRVYQVWLVGSEGQPRSVGVLSDVPSAERPFVTGFRSGEVLAVSVEPDGGSAAPSGDPVVGVTLP